MVCKHCRQPIEACGSGYLHDPGYLTGADLMDFWDKARNSGCLCEAEPSKEPKQAAIPEPKGEVYQPFIYREAENNANFGHGYTAALRDAKNPKPKQFLISQESVDKLVTIMAAASDMRCTIMRSGLAHEIESILSELKEAV